MSGRAGRAFGVLLLFFGGGLSSLLVISLGGGGASALRRENAELRARLEIAVASKAALGAGGAAREGDERGGGEGQDPAEPDPGQECSRAGAEGPATLALREVAREYADVLRGAPTEQHEGVVALAEGCRASQKCQRVVQGRGFTSAIDLGLVRRQLSLLAALRAPLRALAPGPATGGATGGAGAGGWGADGGPLAEESPAESSGDEEEDGDVVAEEVGGLGAEEEEEEDPPVGGGGEGRGGGWGDGEELRAVEGELVSHLGKCMRSHGQGLRLSPAGERCGVNVTIPFGEGEANPHREAATYHFDACRLAEYWGQVRGLTTVLSKSFFASHPHPSGFAARYLNQQYKPGCEGRGCLDLLRRRLPASAPWRPGQFKSCAVVGNSADVKSARMGPEIDRHEAVVRLNNAPTRGYEAHVGRKTTMRVTNHYYAAEHPGLERLPESGEAVVLRSHLGVGKRIFTRLAGGLGRPAGPGRVPLYFMHLPTYFENSAKASGVLAVMFAASVCEEVDVYGFTVDAGFTKWYRYFTAPRKGHAPKRGWAYYQLLECLGVVRLRSPKRAAGGRGSKRSPSGPDPSGVRDILRRLHVARHVRDPCSHYSPPGSCGGGGGDAGGVGRCGGKRYLRYPVDTDVEEQLCVEVP